MRRRFCLNLISIAMISACTATGPVYPVSDELYDWVKVPEAVDSGSDQPPVVADPLVTFHLSPGDRRSALQAPEDWHVGQTYLLGFDVRLDRTTLGTEKVTLSRFLRQGKPQSEIFSVQLDERRGVTVFGRTCIAPPDLANWHRVEVRIKVADNDRGFLEVFCNRKPIWGRVNFRTTLPPECRLSDGCNTVVPKPVDFKWQVGLFSDRGVARDVTVQMQRMHYRTLLYIPGRVGSL